VKTLEKLYRDERGEIITKNQLYDEYKEQKRYEEMTFSQYVRECCSKNGTLEEVIVYGNAEV
jgi:hypothetical protein